MKKKQISALLLAALLTAGLALSASAEDVTGSSDVTIQFTASTGPTKPVDPDDPDEILEPSEPVEGSLAIVWLSDFSFAPGKVSTALQTYALTGDRPNVQIVDLRGNAAGWTLSASVSKFSDEGGQESLKGALLRFKGGRLISNTSDAFIPTVNNVAIACDGVAVGKVLIAPEGRGSGHWVNRWYPASQEAPSLVELEVPAGSATTGEHTAKITWTLSDTPQD